MADVVTLDRAIESHTAFVGRQPIYGRSFDVFAYELLFRNDEVNRASFMDGNAATAQVTLKPLVELADIIKVDVLALDRKTVAEHVEILRQYPVKLLAEKVETHEEFEFCRDLGFDYFQGYFFCKPKIISSQAHACESNGGTRTPDATPKHDY